MLQKPTYEELEKRVRELERAESERIKTEKALRATEANLARAQAVAKLGSWRLNIPNQRLWGSVADACPQEPKRTSKNHL